MRNFKKLLVALLLVLTSFSLTSCTQLNKVTTYFEEQGYVRYQYNYSGESLIFTLHDDLVIEEMTRLGIEIDDDSTDTTTTEAVTTSTEATETTTTEEAEEQDYYGFDSYVFSNGDIIAVVMEFESEDFLLERLADSQVLADYFAGLDQADYLNGNCLLVVTEDYMDNYDLFVDIFQGRLEPIETTEAETTTAAE